MSLVKFLGLPFNTIQDRLKIRQPKTPLLL